MRIRPSSVEILLQSRLFYCPIVQLAERLALNQEVGGSNPPRASIFGGYMYKTVIIRIVPGHDPYEVLEQIRPIGFNFDRVSTVTDDFVLLIGTLEIQKIMLLRNFDGVQSFQTEGGTTKP